MSEFKSTLAILVIIFFLAGVFLFFQGIFTSDPAYTLGGLIAAVPGIITFTVSKIRGDKAPKVRHTSNINPPAVPKKEKTVPQPVDANVCPNCKAPIEPGMFFCDKCGSKLK
jgi:hypothetical protein